MVKQIFCIFANITQALYHMDFSQKKITTIKGQFIIPAYQRGYRWTEREVRRLLDDIYAVKEGERYCLQPIVVKRANSKKTSAAPIVGNREEVWELVDGQQRLTTLYLLLKVLKRFLPETTVDYSLEYATRHGSAAYLDTLDKEHSNDYIDYNYMCKAAGTIDEWFKNTADKKNRKPTALAINLYQKLDEQVEILWYEIDSSEEGQRVFSRLNIGKIPLTNAELVKALFLSESAKTTSPELRQSEIATQWDAMERALSKPPFWAFLTNKSKADFPTRLDLLLEAMAIRPDSRDAYGVFLHFSERAEHGEDLTKIWEDIYGLFLTLQQWYDDRDLFHLGGYVVATTSRTIFTLLEETKQMGRKDRKEYLWGLIKQDLPQVGKLETLTYTTNHPEVLRLLLLMNVLTVLHAPSGERFPFDRFKGQSNINADGATSKKKWSLEHIDAQNSLPLNRQEQQAQWLRDNLPSLHAVEGVAKKAQQAEKLRQEVEAVIGPANAPATLTPGSLTREKFEDWVKRFHEVLSEGRWSPEQQEERMHSIDNLALLDMGANSVLSNSLFETKRSKILEMDQRGEYIPPCTRSVFLKYYTPVGKNQPHYWGEADRKGYLEAIRKIVYNMPNH